MRIDQFEHERFAVQVCLDREKTLADRNRMGQFSTPIELALEMLHYAEGLALGEKIRFLDPAFGTGCFYSALRSVFSADRIETVLAFEIDPHYGLPAARLWGPAGINVRVKDFTLEPISDKFNLVICNPPYVRHHHLSKDQKAELRKRVVTASGMRISGLSGLYCYFLGLTHPWLAQDAICGWLIPSEFMDVNYGDSVKRYLLDRVTLLHIHRFDPSEVQFTDALVSSAIVWFRNSLPSSNHSVRFSFGGTLANPQASAEIPAAILAQETKWTRFPQANIRGDSGPTLSEFFHIKRGIATGDNRYFILTEDQIKEKQLPHEVLTPILPSPRYLEKDEVIGDRHGNPINVTRLYLLDTRLPEIEIKNRFPSLYEYLKEGEARGLPKRYLCSHRTPWYSQETRPPAPLLCTYLGRLNTKRGRPFRFIINNSFATIPNVYLAMYPAANLAAPLKANPGMLRIIWTVLNELRPEEILGEGRVYGGGLHKLEPRELGNVDASRICRLIPEFRRQGKVQLRMFS